MNEELRIKIDEYLSRTDSAGAATILADALGSTIGLTDASGILDGRCGDLIRALGWLVALLMAVGLASKTVVIVAGHEVLP